MVSGSFVDGVGFRVLVADPGSAGVKTISASYVANDVYNGAVGTGVLTVLRHDTVLGVTGGTGYVDDNVNFGVSIKDENDSSVGTGVLDWLVYLEDTVLLDVNDWGYGKLNGTSLSDEYIVDPSITSGMLSTGRGEAVYYDTPLPVDLDEFTIRCVVHGTRLYNRLGVSTVTLNQDSTVSIDLNSVNFLRDITGVVDDINPYLVEFKFLDGVCYIFVDEVYTGISHDYSSVSDDLYLVCFSNATIGNGVAPIVLESLSFVNCVDLEGVPTLNNGGGN